ncbi:MAG: 3-hydroxybutyryl-CoA dehydrogenase, partial [Planctomycetes bacterium]|nr:3-hydroxybutyryl-CoA dehydrogenase [Planctomycetota bacterium]
MSENQLPGSVAVIGAGTMGNGIAQVFATCGVRTFMVDQGQQFLDRGVANIHNSLGKFVEKGKVAADVAERAKSLLSATTDTDVLAGVDLCIEAVTENLEVNTKVFQDADAKLPGGAILASNTSSISITVL